MYSSDNPYTAWLGIPPQELPPNHYRLLGVNIFESDTQIIESSFVTSCGVVAQYIVHGHGPTAQRLLEELARARDCLLDPHTKAHYDSALQHAAQMQIAAQQQYSAQQYPANHNSMRPIPISAANPAVAMTPQQPTSPEIAVSSGSGSGGVLAKKKSGDEITTILEIAKVVVAGIAGLFFAVLFLNYGLGQDPFGFFGKRQEVAKKTTDSKKNPSKPKAPTTVNPSNNAGVTNPTPGINTNNETKAPDESASPSASSTTGSNSNSNNTAGNTSSTVGANGLVPETKPSEPPQSALLRASLFSCKTASSDVVFESIGKGQWVRRSRTGTQPITIRHYAEVSRNDEAIELVSLLNPKERFQLTTTSVAVATETDGWRILANGYWIPRGNTRPISLPNTSFGANIGASLPLLSLVSESIWSMSGNPVVPTPDRSVVLQEGFATIIPVQLPRCYQLDMKLNRHFTGDGVFLGLRLRDTPVVVLLDHGDGHLCGVSGVGGKSILDNQGDQQNPTIRKISCLPAGTVVSISIEANEQELTVAVNGKRTVHYVPQINQLVYPNAQSQDLYSEFLWLLCNNVTAISDVQLTPTPSASEIERRQALNTMPVDRWKTLYSGNDLEQWEDSSQQFQSSNGVLGPRPNVDIANNSGMLTTRDAYQQFELTWELRLGNDKGVRTGIFWGIPSTSTTGTRTRDGNCFLINVSDSRLEVGSLAAAHYALPSAAEPLALKSFNPKEWNKLMLRVWGGRVEMFINEVKSREYWLLPPNSFNPGKIGILPWASDAMIRDVKIRELPALPIEKPGSFTTPSAVVSSKPNPSVGKSPIRTDDPIRNRLAKSEEEFEERMTAYQGLVVASLERKEAALRRVSDLQGLAVLTQEKERYQKNKYILPPQGPFYDEPSKRRFDLARKGIEDALQIAVQAYVKESRDEEAHNINALWKYYAAGKPADAKRYWWKHAQGEFYQVFGGGWVELLDGRPVGQLSETDRDSSSIDLVDTNRRLKVKIYDRNCTVTKYYTSGTMTSNTGPPSSSRFDEPVQNYSGKWNYYK